MFGWLFRSPTITAPTHEKQFNANIAGVSHRNRNGTSRQKIISGEVYAGMAVSLAFEDDNPHDRNAVAALSPSGRQFGYLDSRLAADIRDWHKKGKRIVVTVTDVTGGTSEKKLLGVNVQVAIYPAAAP